MLINLRGGAGPLYRRLYDALKSGIRAGRLAPASRLPSTRALAADLGVSRNTVMLAYEQLLAEGYILSRDRATTAVAGSTPSLGSKTTTREAGDPPRLSSYARRLTEDPAVPYSSSYAGRPGLRYDFRYGLPAIDEFPRQIWRRLLAASARRAGRDSFGYASPAGHAPLREALAEYLRRARGLMCDAEQIVIVHGTQQGIELATRVLLDAGDAAVIEEPHYPGATLSFAAAGARLVRIACDRSGMDTAQLAGVRARLAYVTPCHQFPTGVIMPLERRLALLDWAARTGAWVIEDDYISEFRYEGNPLEALQALDRHGRVIYAGTFSKTLFPALRAAYLVLPRPLVRPFLAAKWIGDRFSATLAQEVLAEFIASGQFERYLRRAGARNAARRRALIGSLRECLGERVEIAGENTGVHLLVWLNDVKPREVDGLIERAARAGVGLYSIAPYYARPPRRAGLLFGYASLGEADIAAGIRRFSKVL